MGVFEWKNKVIDDYDFRTLLFSFFSFLASICFAIYNAFLGIYYHSLFNSSITLYYLFLIVIRLIIILKEVHWRKKGITKEANRILVYKIAFILLIGATLALIVPISLMVVQKRIVTMELIPAIGMAAYTTFKLTTAIINYKKTRKNNQLSVRLLRVINLVDALMSILSLQNVLIAVNGDGESQDMLILSSVTSLGIIICILTVIIISFYRSIHFINYLE